MHLESSMLTPDHFARVALSCGTTTVCADPHEIANVLGIEGVRGLRTPAGTCPCGCSSPPLHRSLRPRSGGFRF